MAYAKTTWVDNSTPAINATNLNKIEEGIEDAISTAEDAQSSITSLDNNKQDTLVSGSNIATINGNDLTAGGNIEIMFEKLKILNEEIIEVPWSFYAPGYTTTTHYEAISYTPVGGSDSMIYMDYINTSSSHTLTSGPTLYRDSDYEGYSDIPYPVSLFNSTGPQLRLHMTYNPGINNITISGTIKIRIV